MGNYHPAAQIRLQDLSLQPNLHDETIIIFFQAWITINAGVSDQALAT